MRVLRASRSSDFYDSILGGDVIGRGAVSDRSPFGYITPHRKTKILYHSR